VKLNNFKIVLRSLNLFFLIFLIIGSVFSGLGVAFYRAEAETFFTSTIAQEHYRVELMKGITEGVFADVVSDLFVLSKQDELSRYLNQGDRQALSVLASEFLAFATLKGVYDQVRFLDATGKELVRVNFNGGAAAIVPPEELQDKGKRYYFTDTLKLKAGEVFVSPLDLNIERGALERPLKPMIRFGTPIVDASGEKRGIVLLNYLGDFLLDRLTSVSVSGLGQTMLLNADGYWLLSPRKEDEWGFMIDARAERSFAHDFPEEWAVIRSDGKGLLQTEHGFFAFETIAPLAPEYRSSTGATVAGSPSRARLDPEDYVWFLISYVSSDVVKDHDRGLLIRVFAFGFSLFAVISVGTWYLAVAVVRRRVYETQLLELAHYDRLTGLPNRTLFFDRIERIHANAVRYARSYGLLYLDLDGFKQVNDSLGHQAGDRLLVQVSEMLLKGVRKADTVSRLGGDEFAIILSDVSDPQGARRLAEKLLELVCEIREPAQAGIPFGMSIGIALYPNDATSPRELILHADQAMYRAKRHGKNQCELYSERV